MGGGESEGWEDDHHEEKIPERLGHYCIILAWPEQSYQYDMSMTSADILWQWDWPGAVAHQEVGPAHQDWQEGGEAPEHQSGQEVCQPGGQVPAHNQSVSKAGKVRIEKPVEVTVMTRSREG